MATSPLWVHVREARVVEPEPAEVAEVQVSVQVGSSSFTTKKSTTPNPRWDQNLLLNVADSDMMESLIVELFKPRFLFRKELVGKTTLPLYTLRHSNKPGRGFWLNLFLPSADNQTRIPTQHQLRLDAHFELPKDIPPEEVEMLERKLEAFNTILEDEVETIENQEHKLITGALSPPPAPAKLPVHEAPVQEVVEPVYLQPLSSPYPEDSRTESDYDSPGHGNGSRYETYAEPPLPEDQVDGGGGGGGGGPSIANSSSSSQQDDFSGFDWTRDNSRQSKSPAPASRVNNTTRHGSLDVSSASTKRDVGSIDPTASLPPMVVVTTSERYNGASAGRHGPGIKTLRSIDELNSSGASVGGGRDVEASLDDLAYTIPYTSARARSHWKTAMDRLLPDIRQQLAKKRLTFPGLLSLSQLVDQMQSYKVKSQMICDQHIVDFSTANSQFRTRSRSVIDVKKKIMYRKHSVDERVKMDVYKQTLEALLYPASEPDSHTFETWSARKPTSCSECSSLLWGLTKQGVRCTRCGKICHERCSSLSSQDCFIHDQHSAISDKMHRMLVNHANRFEILQKAFDMSKEQHALIKEEVESRILKLAENYNAEISITVLAAQGLLIPNNLPHRVYVSVAVGNEKMETEIFRRKDEDKSPPSWNEDFTFNCYNYHDAIQLRVWNKRESAMARMATRFTKEGDLFLGQKIIEVRRVGASQEVWYKLAKRTEKGPDVSGHIKVNISVSVEGESYTSFHQQYIKLHEQMFYYCHVNNEKDLIIVPPKMNPDDHSPSGSMQLLPAMAQEVIDEFALRYAIEPIFRMMIHIELLVNHHSMQNALLVINNMLKNLKYQMFIHVAADHAARAVGATTLMEEYMDASNFGRDKFSKLLDKLLNSLRLDLQQYREFYPHKDEQKLRELVETFELMATVIEFQQQAMGVVGTAKAAELILDSMKECLKNTFDFIVQSNVGVRNTGHPGLDTGRPPFDFFYQIITQIRGVILEDRKVYAKYLPKYCKVDFGDLSAVELWHLFSNTIEGLFDNEANLEVFKPSEYLTLLFTIKSFYDAELKPIPSRKGKVPEFPGWFVRCVQRWLQHQYQKDGMFFLDNAWDDDKNRLKFGAHENQKLSSSAFQMFFYLHQGLEFLLSLESADVAVKEQHYEDFSRVIISMVQYYVDKISVTMPEYIGDLEIMCMLLNNLQALRSNIHRLFEEMGGTENAGPGASTILSEFQQVLSKQLTSWCGFVARSLNPSVLSAVRTVQDSLMKVKPNVSIERARVKEIIKPLFDMLADKLSVIAYTSEQFVLQKIIKEVWYVCMECMHHMLLPQLKWEHDGVQATASVNFPLHHYASKQCTALEVIMDLLKDFFQAAESQGIKMSTIERGIKQLKGVIALYRETTERLITDFISDEVKNTNLGEVVDPVGEVNLAIDVYCHPNSGELDGTIRVISATDLKGFGSVGALRPVIELNLISPTISSYKKKFVTGTAKSSHNPHFNETFKFTLTNWEASEVLILAKHHSKFGKDKIIGAAIISGSGLNDDANHNLSLPLAACLPVTDMGQAVLNVLSARTFYDEFAKEFVALKTSQRCFVGEEMDDMEQAAGNGSKHKGSSLLSGFLGK